jgi:hypothetical protein
MASGAIHSLCNDGDCIALSLHLQAPRQPRSARADPLCTEAPYRLAGAPALAAGAESCR